MAELRELRKLIVGPSSLNLVMHQATSDFPALYHVDSSVANGKKLVAELTKLGVSAANCRASRHSNHQLPNVDAESILFMPLRLPCSLT